jgi:hypothetical protein
MLLTISYASRKIDATQMRTLRGTGRLVLFCGAFSASREPRSPVAV